VDNIPVYKTLIPDYDREELIRLIKENKIDVITFTSSSTVRNFYRVLGEENIDLINEIIVAAIGPITGQTARELGIKVDIIAREYNIPGLVNGILEYFNKWEEV
jgi:uroporphyrinogen III methyltransferase/synthase